ncbi:MAG: WYL domain-containing protein [Oceanospirillales bacterium]|nr:WYL domain-containing protein [Oceanospirillales bacterium]
MTIDFKWESILRFRYLEIMLLWEGKLTTNHLQATFGIKRAQSSRDIKAYKQVAPGNIVYDPAIKGYRLSGQFCPQFSKGTIDEYLNLIDSNSFFESVDKTVEAPATHTYVLKAPVRMVKPEIVRQVVDACRRKRRIEVNYGSMRCPQGEDRIIAPHSIVSSGYRWHVRAYCEKNRDYRDFSLGRILDVVDDLGPALNEDETDRNWHTEITLELIAHPNLTSEQQQLVRFERGFEGLSLSITTRRATAIYMLHYLQVPVSISSYTAVNPVVLKDLSIIEGLRFG